MSSLFQDDGPPPLWNRKVMLATTAYEDPAASYTFAMAKTREAMHAAGLPTSYLLLSGNCHVDDARNVVVQEFLLSDCTELVFIDADVVWEPEDLIRLCGYDVGVVGAVYPFRRDGQAETMPVRLIPGESYEYAPEAPEDGLLEVAGLPTGFMRIKRYVLEQLCRGRRHYHNRGDRRSKVPILFERSYSDELEVRWGGDLHFCNLWIEAGGKLYAAPEIRLGHTARIIVRDSLGAMLRRDSETTLAYVAYEVSEGRESPSLFREARRALGNNPYGALEDTLMLAAIMAREARGPILEAGSGLTSIVMAAASEQPVYCLEHDPVYGEMLAQMANAAGVQGLFLCMAPIVDGWYDLSGYPDLPEHFALALVDGPPRKLGSRLPFYDHFGHRVRNIIVDDADDRHYGDALAEWAAERRLRIDFIEGRAAVIRPMEDSDAAA